MEGDTGEKERIIKKRDDESIRKLSKELSGMRSMSKNSYGKSRTKKSRGKKKRSMNKVTPITLPEKNLVDNPRDIFYDFPITRG